jgi:hypothetical protein
MARVASPKPGHFRASATGMHVALRPAMSKPVLAAALACVLVAACSSSSTAVTSGAPAPAKPASPANPGESEQSKTIPKDTSTELVVGLDGEDFANEGYRLTSWEIVVKVDGVVAARETIDAAAPSPLPHETRVSAPRDRPDAPVEITVRAVMNEAPVVTRRATARFVKGRTLLAYVFLDVRCNTFALLGGSGVSGPTCEKAGETCIGGKCRLDALADLPDYRRDWAMNPPSQCGSGGSSQLEIGQGQDAMAPLEDGTTLAVECGPQGGHHLWLSLRMRDISQSGTSTVLSAAVPGESALVLPTVFPYAWSPAGGGSCELVGVRFQLDVAGGKIADFLGKPLDITVKTQDRAGRKATAMKRVNVSPNRTGPMCR